MDNLTLAPTASSESSGGLLNSRFNLNEDDNPDHLPELQIDRTSQNGLSEFTVYARRPIK
jgi:hypothetical protein